MKVWKMVKKMLQFFSTRGSEEAVIAGGDAEVPGLCGSPGQVEAALQAEKLWM